MAKFRVECLTYAHSRARPRPTLTAVRQWRPRGASGAAGREHEKGAAAAETLQLMTCGVTAFSRVRARSDAMAQVHVPISQLVHNVYCPFETIPAT